MSRKWSEENAVMFIDFDPGGTTAVNVSSTAWLDMSRWNRFTVIAFRTVGSSSVQLANIQASSVAAGTSPTTVLTGGSTEATGCLTAADPGSSIGSNDCGIVVLDITADEIAAQGSDLRYVTATFAMATGTDEMGVLYILSEPRYAATGLAASGNAAS